MSPTSTSDHVEATTPAQAGVARLIGHFSLDVLIYLALVLVLGTGLMFAAVGAGELQPRFTGLHWVHLQLAPCPDRAGRNDALMALLGRHGVIQPDLTRRGHELPLHLLGRIGPDGRPTQEIFVRIDPPAGTALVLSEPEIAETTGCRVGKLAYGPVGEASPERLRLPPGTVALALLASLCAGALAWAWRRPGRGRDLARGGAAGAVALALLAAFAAQGLPRLLAATGLPMAPSNAADIVALVGAWPVLASLLVVLAAPLAEEAFFRGVLLRRFWLAGRPGLGLVLTSGLFALAHELFADGPWWQTLATIGVYASVGALFGAVYLRTGRLWAAVLAHAASNALALAALAYSAA